METDVIAKRSAEIDLLRRAKQGDTGAFGSLVRLYQRRAVSLAYRLLGNASDASDVSQDAFVRAFRSLDQLEDLARFGPWLMRIVSNLSLNFRRSRAARSAHSLDEAATESAAFRRPATGLRWSTATADQEGPLPAELHAAMTEALERLPDQQRLALILFSVEGVPQKEVAEILDCSVELVKWNVFQARKKLKELLADYL